MTLRDRIARRIHESFIEGLDPEPWMVEWANDAADAVLDELGLCDDRAHWGSGFIHLDLSSIENEYPCNPRREGEDT